MNEGINYKVVIGIIVLVLVLFFGVNYAMQRFFNPNSANQTPVNNSTEQTTITPENTAPSTSSNATDNSQEAENITNISTSSQDSKLSSQAATAEETIRKMRANLVFYNLTVDIPASLEIGKSKETYAYGTNDEPDYWYTISASEDTNKFVRAIIPKEDYLGSQLSPIQKDFLKINYISALQIAEKNNGKSFRQDKKILSISASLSQSEPKNYLWWIITYQGENNNKLSVRINANTSEVVDETGQPISTK